MLGVLLLGVVIGSGITLLVRRGDGATKSEIVAPTTVPTIDPTAQPPTHNAVQIMQAATAQGWGPDYAGCSNPNWFPLGVRLTSGGHGASRQWAFTCITGQSGNTVTGAICVTMDDATLAIDSSTGQLCVY